MSQPMPRILVVDDEPDIGENLRDIFGDLGYRVDVAFDGPSALDLVRERHYDVALLDLKMPGMDGLELYRRIRQMSAGTVAIVVTAYASSDTANDVLEAGAWRILSKPIDFGQLLWTVDEAAKQPLVLLVDDDADLCDSLWDLFREQGFRICLAHDIQAAQDHVRRCEHNVVLIDMKLPQGSGIEVLESVRTHTPTAGVVLITGHRGEMERLVHEAIERGANAVCYKPFDVPKLLDTVRNLSS